MKALKTTGIVLLWVLIIAAHIATVGYFVPTHVAIQRRKQMASVIIINILLGWTIIGWIVAMVMAASDKATNAAIPIHVVVNNQLEA